MFQRHKQNNTARLECILSNLSENRIDAVDATNLPLSNDQLKALCDAIQPCGKISKLYLINCQIDDTGANLIANFLRNNNTVTELNLNQNKITDTGFSAIADALIDSNRFKTQQKKYSFIHPDILSLTKPDQSPLFTSQNNTLKSLSCDTNQLSNLTLPTVQRILLGNNSLTSLSVKNNRLSEETKLAIENSRKFNKDISLSARSKLMSQVRHGTLR